MDEIEEQNGKRREGWTWEKRKERRGIREASNVCDHTLGKEEIRGINEGDPPKK